MTDTARNRELNARLEKLYERVQPAFLEEQEKAYGYRDLRINEFGIISEENYDAGQGILIVLKEPSGWSEKDLQDGFLYREFAHGIMAGKWKAPTMTPWYNLGRWLAAIKEPQKETQEIADMFDDALRYLSAAAITNINKTNGYTVSGPEFEKIAQSEVAVRTLKEEVDILKPRIILFCGTAWVLEEAYLDQLREHGCILLDMWHPGARISKTGMIEELRKQLQAQKAES